MKKELTPGQFWGIAAGVVALAAVIFMFASGTFGGSGSIPATEKIKPNEAMSRYEAEGMKIDGGPEQPK